MSTTAKLSMSAMSGMLAAFFLGSALQTETDFASWAFAFKSAALIVCVVVYMRQLLGLHRTLSAACESRVIRESDGRLLIP